MRMDIPCYVLSVMHSLLLCVCCNYHATLISLSPELCPLVHAFHTLVEDLTSCLQRFAKVTTLGGKEGKKERS
jgi:ubiquitin C-terminal hydrolase